MWSAGQPPHLNGPAFRISAINRHRQFALLHAAARARAKGNVDGAWRLSMSKAARTENNDIRGRKAVLRGGRCFRGAGQRLRIEYGVDHCFRFIDHHLGGSVPAPPLFRKAEADAVKRRSTGAVASTTTLARSGSQGGCKAKTAIMARVSMTATRAREGMRASFDVVARPIRWLTSLRWANHPDWKRRPAGEWSPAAPRQAFQ